MVFLSDEDKTFLHQEISKKTNTILVDFEDIINIIPGDFIYSFDQNSEAKKQIEDSFACDEISKNTFLNQLNKLLIKI